MHFSPPDGGSKQQDSRKGFGLAILCLLGIVMAPLTLAAADISFSTDVRPILEQKCLTCHGSDTPMSNLASSTCARARACSRAVLAAQR